MKKFIIGFFASIGAVVVLSSFFLVIVIQSAKNKPATVEPSTILQLNLTGMMVENKPTPFFQILGSNANSLYHNVQAIDQASKDPRVKGLVARLDYAQMGLAQAQELRNAILRFRAAGKFTLAYADTFGEFGPGTVTYYLASSFDEIWVQPLGQVGLTGLFMEVPFAKDAAEAIGIEAQVDKRKEFKTVLDSLTETNLDQKNREVLQNILDSLISQVVADISTSRELPEADVERIINHGPLLGTEALKSGMIDRIAYFDEIKPYLKNKVADKIHLMKAGYYLEANPVTQPKEGKPKLALIFGVGTIKRNPDKQPNIMTAGDMGSGQTIAAFEEAIADQDVAAIVFRINSPGGSPVASESILHAARKAQKAGKPVIVSMSDLAGSGGYWVASYANKIVAHPTTITGSIGVAGGKIVLAGLWEKIGVNWDQVHAGDNANMWSMNRRYTAYGWQRLDAWLDYVYTEFIDRVAQGRKLPREHVEHVAKGRIWSGKEALRYKLVDKLGGLKEAITIALQMKGLQDQKVAVEVFPKPKTFMEKLQLIFFNSGNVQQANLGWIGALMKSLDTVSSLMDALSYSTSPNGVTSMPFKEVKG